MVSVIPDLSVIDKSFKSATIVLTSDNADFPRAIEELKDPEVITAAMAYAVQKGMRDPRANRASGAPYAVNAKGENVLQLMNGGAKAGDPAAQVHGYRVNVKLIAPPM